MVKIQFVWFLIYFVFLSFWFFGFFWAVWKFWREATALCLWVSVAHTPNHVRKGLVARFLTILEFSIFVKNLILGYFGRPLDTRGFWKSQFFGFYQIFFYFGVFSVVGKFWREATALCLWVSVSH